jgi:RHS repeat-associated protein
MGGFRRTASAIERSPKGRVAGILALLTLFVLPATADATTLPGTITKNTTLTVAESPYFGNSTIEPGVTVTVEPGVTFLIGELTVKGTLLADGTSEAPIVFSGGVGKSPGEWERIKFEPGSGASILDHAAVEFGSWSASRGMVEVVKSSPTITNSKFSKSGGFGIRVVNGGAPVIADNAFLENSKQAIKYEAAAGDTGEINIHGNSVEKGGGGIYIWVDLAASVAGSTLSENTVVGTTAGVSLFYSGPDIPNNVSENTLLSNYDNCIYAEGTVAHTSMWQDGGAVLCLDLGVTIASGKTLTMGPGLIMLPGHSITVKGTLIADGNAAAPIVFSSPTEIPGGWEQIKFEPGSGASLLDHVEAKYGSWSTSKGMIEVAGVSPTITNSTFRRSTGYGIKVIESGSPKIEGNRFRSNGTGGLAYSGAGVLAAPSNDWGCASGPKPAGCGDAISGNVSWRPAIQLPELTGHCRGESQCGKGADPVTLATGELSYSHRDLLLTNRSKVPLEFARAYSSGSSADTGLGPGWSQSGLASASELQGGEVLVLRQDGRQDVFEKAEGGYRAPSGVTDSLAKVEGTFQLTALDRTVSRFDSSGRIASITDDHGLETTYAYDGNGRLSTIADPSGQALTFAYNGSNHISSITDSTGREVKFAYSAAGDLESATDALGGVTKYAYDAQHRLTSITDPRGNVILKNTYDSQGRITEQRDGLEDLWKLEYKPAETVVTEPEGGELAYGFDAQSRVVSETDQLGHTTTTAYDAAGNVKEVVRPGGAKWVFGHDGVGNLTSVVDPLERERSYSYDAQNRLTGFTDARGNSWTYEWSAGNDLTKITDPEGGETTVVYSGSGQPLTITDANEHKSEFSYDTRGNQLSATDPLGHKTSFEYNSRNYLTARSLPGLKAEAFEVNALGDVVVRTTPEGHKTKYAYDANGLPRQVTDPAEGVWKIERNAMERPIAFIDPLGQESRVAYDGNLRPTKLTNRRGKETTYGYDLANRLTEVHAPEGGDWAYGYDPRGNRTSATDPRENETTYGYDLLDRMTSASGPLEVATEYGYDANGDLTSVQDPRGNTTSYVFDKLGRLTEVVQPLEKTTGFTYDAVGNMLSRTTAIGTVEYGHDAANRLTKVSSGESTSRSFGYDAANRLTTATDAEGHKIEIGHTEEGRVSSINDGRGQSLSRSYDPRGLLTKQVDGRGTLEYGYDKLGRVTSLTDPQSKALGFAYNPEGDLAEVTRPNGVTTTNVYDDAGRLAETTSKTTEPLNVLESLEYDYDPAGNVASKVDQRLEQQTGYEYDALNRLTEFNPPGEGSTSYDYDAAGNRTEADGITYAYNALNQLTESSDGTTYRYDGAGRLTEKINAGEETTYEWDPLDHLAKVEGPTETASYSYDALERLSERRAGEATQVTHYGDLTDRATYLTNGAGEATTSYVQGPLGLIEQRSGEATRFPLTDAHGDVTAITGPSGEVESRQSYDAWGAQLSGPTLEMGYLGAYQRPTDPLSGLIQMGARVYDPALGRFASEDPVYGHFGIGTSFDRYLYVWDNPVNRYDLNGRDVCVFGACAGDAGESIAGFPGELDKGAHYVEKGAEKMGTAAAGAADDAWDWTAPGRGWLADRSRDFWKDHGLPLENVYRFAGANWQLCVKGAAAGAAFGAGAGTAAFGVGAVPGAIGGGFFGCGSVVGANYLFELGL